MMPGTVPVPQTSPANPSAGVQNMMLSPGGGSNGSADMSLDGKDNDAQILDAIEKLRSASTPEDAQNAVKPLEPIVNGMSDSDVLKAPLTALVSAGQFNWHPNTQTDGDATPDEMISRVTKLIEDKKMDNNNTASSNTFNLYRLAQGQDSESPGAVRKKKKTRGNPFRVLMGKVQKLLDHGLKDNEIVRHIAREGKFDEELIDKCVDVVKSYNKRKDFKDKTEESSSGIIANTFNLHELRLASKDSSSKSILDDLYHCEPAWAKRSSGELLSRLAWLKDAKDYGKNTKLGDGKAIADKTGIAGQIKAITSALKDRGFSAEEIDSMS